MLLHTKSAIITGAASGIGRAIALKFACEGAAVMVADLNGDAATELTNKIKADGGTAFGIRADISKRKEIDAMVAQLGAWWLTIDAQCLTKIGFVVVRP